MSFERLDTIIPEVFKLGIYTSKSFLISSLLIDFSLESVLEELSLLSNTFISAIDLFNLFLKLSASFLEDDESLDIFFIISFASSFASKRYSLALIFALSIISFCFSSNSLFPFSRLFFSSSILEEFSNIFSFSFSIRALSS